MAKMKKIRGDTAVRFYEGDELVVSALDKISQDKDQNMAIKEAIVFYSLYGHLDPDIGGLVKDGKNKNL